VLRVAEIAKDKVAQIFGHADRCLYIWTMIVQRNGRRLQWSEVFRYDAESGRLYWIERPKVGKTGGLKRVGELAGSRGAYGHCVIEITGKNHFAHRIIWEMHNGPIPKGLMIDHIDGNGWNNRLNNLRLVTAMQNSWNCKPPKSNTSGHVGVVRYRKDKWRAMITANKKVIHLGIFDNIEEAAAARQRGKALYHNIESPACQ
jgi:hypothetical protein